MEDNFLTNVAPCLLTSPDASFTLDFTFDKNIMIAYFDLEGDSLAQTWSFDQSRKLPGYFTGDGLSITITSCDSIAGLTVNIEIFVSEADQAYLFTMVLLKIPTEAPLSTSDISTC
jgi:hypothetical protein